MKQTPRDPWHDPSEPRNLSGVQFEYVHPGAPKQHPNLHSIVARNSEGKYLGFMDWHKKTGKIDNISVTEPMRGLGIGTSLFERANKLSEDTGIIAPKHSSFRTDKGDAWAKAVGGKLPKRSSVSEEPED